MKKGINVGELIRVQVDKAGIPINDFAKLMDKTRSNVYNIFEREDMSTDIIRKASNLLGHNFFQDLADEYASVNDKGEKLDEETQAVAQFFKTVPALLREIGRDSQIIFDEDEENVTPDLILPEYNLAFTKGETYKERIEANSIIKKIGHHNFIRIFEEKSESGCVIELILVADQSGFLNIKLDYKTKEEWKEVLEFAFSIIDKIISGDYGTKK